MAYLRDAVAALKRGVLLEVRGMSKVYETEPVDVRGEQPEYLNCVVEVEYAGSALELLCFCQGVEAALGRDRKGEKLPRTVDIDILLFGGEILENPRLVVPHPGVKRAFNLRGLADLDADLRIPAHGSVGDLLAGASLAGVGEYGEEL